jgi:hypothetical protein
MLNLKSGDRIEMCYEDSPTTTIRATVGRLLTFIWQLPSSPTIGAGNFVPGGSFAILDVPYSENGVDQTPSEFDFFSSSMAQGGGFQIITPSLTSPANTFGAQRYSGMESAPTFVPGTYDLNNGSTTGPLGTLVISSVTAPEPSSLILMGSGLLSLLGFARKKILA